MSSMEIDRVLSQIRALSQQTQLAGKSPAADAAAALRGAGGVGGAGGAPGVGGTGFATLLKQGVEQVNRAQTQATQAATAFEKGVPGVELSQVMLEMQKANVSF